MNFYHCLPKEYFDQQTKTGDWIPYYGSTWLADTDRHAFQASQIPAKLKVIVEFNLDEQEVEDHSDMAVCKRLGRSYYLYRGIIPKNKMTVIKQWEAAE